MIALLLFLILAFLVLRSLSIMTLEVVGAGIGLIIILIIQSSWSQSNHIP